MKRIKLVPVQFKMFGEMIGGIMSLIQGKKQKASGEKKIAQSELLMPAAEDSEQRLAYEKLANKADTMYSGAYASTLTDNLAENFAGIKEGAMSLASGGGSDVTALMKVGNQASGAFNDILGAVENRAVQYDSMANTALDHIAQRKLELQLMKHQEKRYDGVTELSAGNKNIAAGQAGIAGGVGQIMDTAATLGIGALKSGINKGKSE